MSRDPQLRVAWGDGTDDATGTSASQSHVYATAGTYTVSSAGTTDTDGGIRNYTITLVATDNWGRTTTVTHTVTVT